MHHSIAAKKLRNSFDDNRNYISMIYDNLYFRKNILHNIKPIYSMINMRKLNPDAGRGFMGGNHMGYGYRSSDPCW
jgi:hypothetical protein